MITAIMAIKLKRLRASSLVAASIISGTICVIPFEKVAIASAAQQQIEMNDLGRLKKGLKELDYLLKNWEAKLSPEMKELFVPHDVDDAANLSVDIDSGPFKMFPHYPCTGGFINYERANALSDLTGWTILENADLWQKIFSS